MHPRVGASDPGLERMPGPPASRVDPLVAEVARLYTHRALDVPDLNLLPSHVGDGPHELRHRDILGAPDIRRPQEGGRGAPINAVHHVADIRVGANRLPTAPHPAAATIARLGHLPADGGRRP